MTRRITPSVLAVASVLTLASTGFGQEAEYLSDPTTRAWFEVGGRFHIAIVHFPVALILAALFLEILAMLRSRAISPAGLACLNLGWIGGVFALGTGWYLARLTLGDIETDDPLAWLRDLPEDEMDRDLFIHAWTGLGATVLGLVLSVVGAIARRRERASALYRLGLLVAALLVAWAGHMGGEMVHGEDFLTEPLQVLREDAEEPRQEPVEDDEAVEAGDAAAAVGAAAESAGAEDDADADADAEENAAAEGKDEGERLVARVDFDAQIRPIFAQHCFKCHGEERGKGGLRMHRRAELFPADLDDWTVIPGRPDESELLERIALDPSARKFMPKKGDPLPAEQVALIRRWIEEGAVWSEASSPATGSGETAGAEPPVIDLEAKKARLERVEELVGILRERGASASPLARGDERLDLNFSVLRDRFGAADLEPLAGFEAQVVELNLASTPSDDAVLDRVSAFTNLERLHLERTGVTDAGLARLSGLARLNYLNLYGTAVTDAGLRHLEGLGSLRKLYLWDSGVTRAGAEALKAKIPGLVVDLGESLLPLPAHSPDGEDG